MSEIKTPLAIDAMDVAPRTRPSNYPAPFSERMSGRIKRALGDVFGLEQFGVNHTRLAAGAQSALRHRHSAQEEFVYILSGCPVLITDDGETRLHPGMCAGFVPRGSAHHLLNRSDQEVCYLEIGTRVSEDSAVYPDDDLLARSDGDGTWTFTHQDGTPYPV
jgi:uncharacterized cupin superfamily protein